MVDQKPLQVGETVYVWRATHDFKGWIGPGILIAESENQRSLWVSVRGYLVKASREQVRRATSDESLGADLIRVLSTELLENLENGRLKNFKDIEQEGGPIHNPETWRWTTLRNYLLKTILLETQRQWTCLQYLKEKIKNRPWRRKCPEYLSFFQVLQYLLLG